jgi:hypothetical protein
MAHEHLRCEMERQGLSADEREALLREADRLSQVTQDSVLAIARNIDRAILDEGPTGLFDAVRDRFRFGDTGLITCERCGRRGRKRKWWFKGWRHFSASVLPLKVICPACVERAQQTWGNPAYMAMLHDKTQVALGRYLMRRDPDPEDEEDEAGPVGPQGDAPEPVERVVLHPEWRGVDSAWLAPDGTLTVVQFGTHTRDAVKVGGHEEAVLERMGWLKLSEDQWVEPVGEATQAQWTTIFDWCEANGRSIPIWMALAGARREAP